MDRNWEGRFDDIYWSAFFSEKERVIALKEQVIEERKAAVKDVLSRIANLPIRGILTEDQEKIFKYIRGWFNSNCIPQLIKDYDIKEWNTVMDRKGNKDGTSENVT